MIDKDRRKMLGQITAAVAAVMVAPLAVACDDKSKTTEHVVEIKGSQFFEPANNPAEQRIRENMKAKWKNKYGF